ncbi:class I SAM-dependent methyltransferase [Halocatena pleomorpha]|uniref:Class I SAM-dependent methyltransferase n=1 Tax=Halocatena pleomorpha TaxID=1785090 RepID=A0A3P3RMK7_9EURY|nr:class I SAM-dependent methyltransferase [Halocatena pleomorpha]RRJ33623.1 class I SAM-dependent methyltransferase [Halocatena pleomorpha]
MKKTIEEHAARFDDHAGAYDEQQPENEEYRACVSLVIDHAAPEPSDTVLDLGTGTGAIGLSLAADAARVVGRDISDGMMDQAREKAAAHDIENVAFGTGTFREPNYDGPVDIVVSNFALHHLSDDEKRAAIKTIAALGPQRFVLGDVMFFDTPDPDEPYYDPEVDDPSTVGVLADALTDAGFSLTAVERIHEQVGVLVAERTTRSEE